MQSTVFLTILGNLASNGWQRVLGQYL
jgi:hypothetical protein